MAIFPPIKTCNYLHLWIFFQHANQLLRILLWYSICVVCVVQVFWDPNFSGERKPCCFGGALDRRREDGRRRKLRRGREAENHFYYYCENVSYTVVHVNLPQTFAWQRDFRPRYAPPNFYKCIFSFATRGAKAWKAAHHLLVVLKNISDITFPYPILHLKHEKCNSACNPWNRKLMTLRTYIIN